MIMFFPPGDEKRQRRPGRLQGRWLAAILLLGASASAGASSAMAGETKAPVGRLDPLFYYQRLRQYVANCKPPEIFEMLNAIAHGSEMGPGDGWFHGAQSRYGWNWLAAHYDANHDGRITAKEFRGPPELFKALDRNHDGVLTPADFDWSDRSPYLREAMPSRIWFSRIDGNGNGRITREEWLAYFDRIRHDKAYLTPEDLREAFPVAPPSSPPPGTKPKNDGPSPVALFRGLLSGELGSMFEGPAVGDRAPDFQLRTHDGKQTIRLSQYRGQKPVVLVFGSFT
jgi:AhpC/TSA family/EF hand